MICHGDLQPLNILAQGERLTGVIDWGACTVADPALDLGVSLALLCTVPVGEGPLSPLTRALLRGIGRAHVRAYARIRPLDPAAVRCYQAYGCLSQLLWVALARAGGWQGRGIFESPEGVRNLGRHFAALTDVTPSLAA